ncbi:MAG TPA: alpha/beta hydrolase [Ktedonobacterales bacterium]|nr:alpha/beta hydrolase [Ktedonobacterales bacterium]
MTSSTSDTAVPRKKSERTVNVRGIETHLFEGGSPDAPPLLYLHGTMLGNLWLEYHQRLAARFHLFAPDTPGFGLTQRPDWMRDMSDYVLYFRDLLDTLGLERPIIVGHSLGGWMAVEVAVWFPERVSKLVLSNAVGIRVKGSPLGNLFAMNPQELFAAVFDDPAAGAPLIPAEMSHEYIIDQFRQRTTLAALAWNPHYDPKLERRLERVQAPTLVIWGANDRLVPAVYGERYQQLIAGAKLVTLQGTGHMPMFEQPARWSEEITTFLLAES